MRTKYGKIKIQNNLEKSYRNDIQDQRPSVREYQKHPLKSVSRKRCCENMQQIYRRTPMSKCDFNKVALQLY